ncbi:MAG TPA: glycosyltransferase [Steroidobacteraceae bacterium]|nr:glycosyltransferase [Steroidobacteraceae bacterium]
MGSASTGIAAAPLSAAQACDTGMRALFVLSSLARGGSETKVVRVVNSLRARGISTGVAYLNAPEDLRAELDPAVPAWHLERRGKLSLSAIGALRSIVRNHKPDVVLAVNLYPVLYIAGAVLGMTKRPRTVGLINTSEFRAGTQWQASLYRPLLRRFDRTVYGSESQRVHWQSMLRYPSERSMVLYNGVDPAHFAPDETDVRRNEERRRLGVPPHGFVVGTVGRMAPEKNQAVLIDAVAELRRRGIEASLLFIGDGALRGELEQRATALGIRQHAIFAGKVSDVRPALCAMDVFVLPSTQVETFSNAALEAMAMGKAVVLSEIGGATEMVSNGIDGFTLDRTQLDSRLVPLLAELHAKKELRERIGTAARERVLREFSQSGMVAGYATLIDELGQDA